MKIKSKDLNYILENNIQSNSSFIRINMSDSLDIDKEYIRELMKRDNGFYRITKGSSFFDNEVRINEENSNIGSFCNICLFYNTVEQVYFGWGRLDSIDDMNEYTEGLKKDDWYKGHGLYGPFNVKPFKKYIKTYSDDSIKQVLKFANVGIFEEAELKDKYSFYDIDRINSFNVKNVSRSSIEVCNIIDINSFKNLLGNKRLIKSENIISSYKDIHSLIEQIDSYDIENIHTAFLKNFIEENNIYNLNDKPLKKLISLIMNKKISFYKDYDDKSIINDNYIVVSQVKYKDENGNRTLQPDIVLKGDKYIFIIEVKYYSFENNSQTERYFNIDLENEQDNKKIKIYVYLYLDEYKGSLKLSGDSKQEKYIKIKFKDMINEVYLDKSYKFKNNTKYILDDYLKGFMMSANPNRNISIESIPVKDYYSNEKINIIYRKLKGSFPENSIIQFNNISEITYFRYCLAVKYNLTKSKQEKDIIKNMYNQLRESLVKK